MNRTFFILAAAASTLLLSGCISGQRSPRPTRAAGPVASTPPSVTEMSQAHPSAIYRGDDGRPTDVAATVAEWQDADIVAFGELHGDLVGAKAQLAVLQTMAAQGKPVALAMEFMERDTQRFVDAYLSGAISGRTFRKWARQSPAYPHTHGPLVEFCKAHGFPVIAANAPRRLVSAYRKQDKDYEGYLESLEPKDRRWLPEETSIIEDAYWERFAGMMGGERARPVFRSQSLWDDAMAEAMYDFRQEHPDHRILFIVGGFHVRSGLGTITKYKLRRGKDDIRVIYMTMDQDPALPFRDEDIGTGDLIIKVPYPKRPAMRGPNPHAKPRNPHKKTPAAAKPAGAETGNS